jgi:hypothetical protein
MPKLTQDEPGSKGAIECREQLRDTTEFGALQY